MVIRPPVAPASMYAFVTSCNEGPHFSVDFVPMSHQSPKFAMALSIKYARCQASDPLKTPTCAIRYQMGAFITNERSINTNTIPRRMTCVYRRANQKPRPNAPEMKVNTGPLDPDIITMMHAPINPHAAKNLSDFFPNQNNPINIGNSVAAKVPAKIAWPNGP